jgi:hypothetical protein
VLDRVGRGLSKIDMLGPHGRTAEAARRLFEDAAELATTRPGRLRGVQTWITGAEIDSAWRTVHAAEELLVLVEDDAALASQIPSLAAGVRDRLPTGDERSVAYLAVLSKLAHPSDAVALKAPTITEPHTPSSARFSEAEREQIRAINSTLNEIGDDAHARLRSFRNLALGATVALTAVAVVLAFDPPQEPWLPICAPSDAAGHVPPCATVAQIETVGAMGGLLAVVAALVSFQGFSGPYALPTVMAALKVPAGALTGLVGAIWMQSEVFGFKAQAGGKILAFVAVFGFAQQAITAFADRQAGQLLGQAQGKPPP